MDVVFSYHSPLDTSDRSPLLLPDTQLASMFPPRIICDKAKRVTLFLLKCYDCIIPLYSSQRVSADFALILRCSLTLSSKVQIISYKTTELIKTREEMTRSTIIYFSLFLFLYFSISLFHSPCSACSPSSETAGWPGHHLDRPL